MNENDKPESPWVFPKTHRTYDLVGNLIQTVDRRGQTNTFTYDARGDWGGAGLASD